MKLMKQKERNKEKRNRSIIIGNIELLGKHDWTQFTIRNKVASLDAKWQSLKSTTNMASRREQR